MVRRTVAVMIAVACCSAGCSDQAEAPPGSEPLQLRDSAGITIATASGAAWGVGEGWSVDIERAIAGKSRSDETGEAVASLASEGARILNYNQFKAPLMENLVKRALRA